MPVTEFDLAFDVYPPEDPAGKVTGYGVAARLVRLTLDDQLVDGDYVAELFGSGSGFVEIHVDNPDAEFLQKRGYVQVIRMVGSLWEVEEPIGGFWLSRGFLKALSASEQKGRVVRWEGEGGSDGLDRYNLGHAVFATGQTLRGDRTIPGKWAWNDEPYGAMLVRVLEEGFDHPSGFYNFFDWDFTRTVDSNDNAWSAISDYETPIGTSGLKLWADFLKLGLVAEVSPDLTIHAYRDLDEYRTDRHSATFAAGKVRFEVGVNITADLLKRLNASSQRTHVLYEDRIGDYQTIDEDEDGNPIDGVPYMTYRKSTTTADDAAIVRMGGHFLSVLDRYVDVAKVRHLIGAGGIDGENGYLPSPTGDYWLGDLVTIHSGTTDYDFNEQTIEVAAIRYFVQGNQWMVEAELGAQYRNIQQQQVQSQIAQTVINQIASIQLCTPTLVESAAGIQVEAEQYYSAGGGATVTGSLPAGYDDGTYLAIQHGMYDGGLSGAGDGIPDGPGAGWTAIGSGGFSGGASSGVGQHGFYRVLQPGDTSIGTWSSPITGVRLLILSGAQVADPIGTIASGTEPSGQMSWNSLTPEITDGTSRFLMIGVHEAQSIQGQTVTGTQAVTALTTYAGGQHAAWLSVPAAAWAAHTINVSPDDDRLETTYEIRASAVDVVIPGAGREELVGTSVQAKRCDDTEHWHEVGSGAPTADDDVNAGFRVGTLWINDDGEAWLCTDNTAGSADWLALVGGGSGGGYDEGTSFPGSPSPNDKFYRTDRNLLYFYDGTRWLTVAEYDFGPGWDEHAGAALSSTQTVHRWPVRQDYGMYLTRWVATTFQTAGTPGTNFFTVVLARVNASNTATTITSFVTSSDTASNWVNHDQAIGAVLDSSARILRTVATESGNQTGFILAETICYRLIG